MNAMLPDIDALYEKTKGNLFFKKRAGFYGSLLCRLNFEWTRDHGIDTAAISSTTLYWNPDFFMSIDKETRITVLAHEIEHNARMHGARMGNRCPDVWNQAGDHAINLDLEAHGYYMGGFPYLMDHKYIGWATEDIYDDLMKGGGKPMPIAGLGRDVIKTPEKDIPKHVATVLGAVESVRMSGRSAPGNIPGEVSLVLDNFLNAKLPWHTLLFNFFNAMVDQDISYARPNRRYDEIIMPGNIGRSGLDHLIYAIDISGSTTDEQVEQSNNEVRHIQEDLEPEKLTLITFDTKICDEFFFERGESYEGITVHGRGGTRLEPVYEYARKHEATALVILTDLKVHIPPDPKIPIIFVCVDNPTATVPYGVVVHLDTTS